MFAASTERHSDSIPFLAQVGLLLQCCECLYWSHGDCVGLEDPPGVPYFCPECRPEQHLPRYADVSRSSIHLTTMR
jgi:hypothetical protein